MKKILYILIIAFLTIGCEKTIDFNGEITAPMLVVNSIISPDSTIVAEVSSSRFFLEKNTGTKYIENADLKLIVNGVDRGKLVKYPSIGTYGADYKVSAGDEVKIEVSAPGFAPVSGLTKIPLQPTILAVDTSSTSSKKYDYFYYYETNNDMKYDTIGEFRELHFRFKMRFQDKGKEKNFYRFVVKQRTYFDKNNPSSGGLINESDYFERYLTNFDDVIFQNQNQNQMGGFEDIFGEGGNSYHYNVFSDDLIDGKEYDIQFSDYIRLDQVKYEKSPYEHDTNNPEKTVYLIYLHEISPDFYWYVRSMISASNVGDNPFVEPVQVRSNIENGIGLFTSYTSSKPFVIEVKH